jgi:hypothetical protein
LRAHREPAGSGFRAAVGVCAQTGAPHSDSLQVASQSRADTARHGKMTEATQFVRRTDGQNATTAHTAAARHILPTASVPSA